MSTGTHHHTSYNGPYSPVCVVPMLPNTLISVSSVNTATATIARNTKLITNTLIVLTNRHKIDKNSSTRAIYKKANYMIQQKLRPAYYKSLQFWSDTYNKQPPEPHKIHN